MTGCVSKSQHHLMNIRHARACLQCLQPWSHSRTQQSRVAMAPLRVALSRVAPAMRVNGLFDESLAARATSSLRRHIADAQWRHHGRYAEGRLPTREVRACQSQYSKLLLECNSAHGPPEFPNSSLGTAAYMGLTPRHTV